MGQSSAPWFTCVVGCSGAMVATSTFISTAAAQQPREGQGAVPAAEIVVTAQKREQRLQDVPISVTAISSQTLQDMGVRDIKELTLLTPGLTVTSSSNESLTTARLRGIGTVGDNPGLESSVGVVIDGVYRPRNGVSFGDLGELDRIEVLKGPQGTLFGKNTSAGVINVITKQPEFDVGSNLELTAGNFGTLDGALSVTGPLFGENVAGRLYAVSRKRDGFYDVNTGNGPRTDNEDSDKDVQGARGQLLIRATDDMDIRLIADYARRRERCCVSSQLVVGRTGPIIDLLAPDAGLVSPGSTFDRDVFSNRSTGQSIRDQGVSAELNWDLGTATLTSISAWRNWESVNGQDQDYTTVDIQYREANSDQATEFGQISQELRLAGATERLNWALGAFYAAEDLDAKTNQLYGAQYESYYSLLFSRPGAPTPELVSQLTGLAPGTAFPVGTGARDAYNQDSDAYALFTNSSITVTEQLELTVGLRYTNEQKDLDALFTNTGGAAGCTAARANFGAVAGYLAGNAASISSFYGLGCAAIGDPVFNNLAQQQRINESEWSGTTKLAYRFTEDVMSYVSYARGYKASGYNLDRERILVSTSGPPVFAADPDMSFDPEIVDSWELGAKTTWLDNSLLLNAALFYQEFADFQLNTFTGTSFVVTSIPEVTSQGVDFDFIWLPLGVDVGGGNLSMQGGVTYAETEYGDFAPPFAGLFRLPGNQMSFAPKWSGGVSMTYDRPIGANLLWRGTLGAKATSSYNTGSDLNPVKMQDALTLVNARIALGSQSERWTLEAWAQNLTDEDYYQIVFDALYQSGTFNTFLGTPRIYGLTLRMQF
jgi:iron complex outermembrane recepter protein